MGDQRPVSYATRDEARAYVARVLSRTPPAAPAAVYAIAAPDIRASGAWGKIAPVLRRMLPGAEVLEFHDVFTGAPGLDERISALAARVGGAVVIPRAWHTPEAPGAVRYLLGYAARGEALGLLGRGLPVLVLTPAGMVAWPDVRVRPAEGAPLNLPLELELPAPGAELLPTVAASYRALGLPRPRPRAARRPGPRTRRAAVNGQR